MVIQKIFTSIIARVISLLKHTKYYCSPIYIKHISFLFFRILADFRNMEIFKSLKIDKTFDILFLRLLDQKRWSFNVEFL